MALIFVTRQIPEVGIQWMRDGGHEVVVSDKDGVLTSEELRAALSARPYDGGFYEEVLEADSRRGDAVERRRPDFRIPVAAGGPDPLVVGQDEDNVRA